MHRPAELTAHVAASGPDPRARNSYDFVRFCAASGVLFSHHFDLVGLPEPQVPGYGGDAGELAVEVFFALSGFLICLSLQKQNGWARFIFARILRIFPNLAFVLVVTSLVTLLWYGNEAQLRAHADYVADNLLLFVKGVTFVIPGIFADATRTSINDPLWTLPYELWCYVLLSLLFLLGGKWRGAIVIGATLLTGLAWSLTPAAGEFDFGPLESAEFFRLVSFFLSGAVIAVFWESMKPHALAMGIAGLSAMLVVRQVFDTDTIFVSLALAAATIGLGHSKAMAWFSKGGDASYGMYVFAWPVQQFSILLIGSFWVSLGVAFLVTAAIGYATWHAFEKRAMAYPGRLAAMLTESRLTRAASRSS